MSKGFFTTKDTKITKFGLSPEGFRPQGGILIIRTLRVLRAFVVKTSSRYPQQHFAKLLRSFDMMLRRRRIA